ncbi:MAG: phage virion morphogenesis protein [Nitrosomonadales bacterium]|nr:phage virion morphogenesis protein [Nitrosomonadales bacterium]
MLFEMNFQVDHLDRALTAARRAIEKPAPLMDSIGESLLRVNKDRHSAGLAPDGSKWKPLSPLTIGSAILKAQGGAYTKDGKLRQTMSLSVARKVQAKRTRILHASGDMLKSFHYRAVGNSVTLGFDGSRESDLAAWHHSGTKPYEISPKKAKALSFAGLMVKRVHHPGLPARRLVGLPVSDRQLISEVTHDYLTVILNRVR